MLVWSFYRVLFLFRCNYQPNLPTNTKSAGIDVLRVKSCESARVRDYWKTCLAFDDSAVVDVDTVVAVVGDL